MYALDYTILVHTTYRHCKNTEATTIASRCNMKIEPLMGECLLSMRIVMSNSIICIQNLEQRVVFGDAFNCLVTTTLLLSISTAVFTILKDN